MHTRRLTRTFFSASRREPVARLVDTTAGRSWGVMPTATASENSTASISGLSEQDVHHEDRDRQHAAHAGQQRREAREAELKLRLRLALAQADRDPPELGEAPGGDDDGVGRALVHDGAHEQARRQIGEGAHRRSRRRETLGVGSDSPVRIDSSHSRLSAVSRRTSAGTIEPTSRCTTSPGTEMRDLDAASACRRERR